MLWKNDYYPFGMQMPGRKFSAPSSSYRYGFNGKENDNDVKGEGNQQDYGMRIYDGRLGRFLSRDPLTSSYPYYTPYSFAGNKPIWCIDLDGCEDSSATKGLWLTGNFWDDLMAVNKRANPTLEAATTNGVIKSVRKTWGFITTDAWKAQTWENAAKFVEQGAFSMSSVPIANTPMVDAKVDDFMSNVVKGNSYSRTEYFSEFGMDFLTAYVTSKGLGNVKSFVVNTVKTDWSIAKQSLSLGSIEGAAKAKGGAKLYRIGTTGKSAQGAAAQFWSLENPLLDPAGYAKKYNVPLENIKNANFVETANLKKGANFVSREAGTAPGSANTGKGVEIVVEKGGTTNNVIKSIKN